MKKVQQTIMAASLMLLALSSCKKAATDQSGTAPINNASKISKIEHADDYSEISYNTDGSIKSIVTKTTNGMGAGTLSFTYDGPKIKEATTGSIKLKYAYAGSFVVKVETINGVGVLTHRNEFSYLNTHLAEIIEFWPNGAGGLKPFSKTIFSYNNAGNVTKAENLDFVNNAWAKTGEIAITGYDSKPNTSSSLESGIL